MQASTDFIPRLSAVWCYPYGGATLGNDSGGDVTPRVHFSGIFFSYVGSHAEGGAAGSEGSVLCRVFQARWEVRPLASHAVAVQTWQAYP